MQVSDEALLTTHFKPPWKSATLGEICTTMHANLISQSYHRGFGTTRCILRLFARSVVQASLSLLLKPQYYMSVRPCSVETPHNPCVSSSTKHFRTSFLHLQK